MPARWSLRTRLVAVVAVTLLPVLALAAWNATEQMRLSAERRAQAVMAAAEVVVVRHRELVEGTRRLLAAMCSARPVEASAGADAPAADVRRCEAYLSRVVETFPAEYSTATVTDAHGVARCSNMPAAIGMEFSDREIFRLVRDSRRFEVGGQTASRVTPGTVIPMAIPVLQDGAFLGMCAIDLSLKAVVELTAPVRAGNERAHKERADEGHAGDGIALSLVDQAGTVVGGSAEAGRTLPPTPRLAAAIADRRVAFSEYGQDGKLYELRLLPLGGMPIFVVAAAPRAEGFLSLVADWGGFALVVLTVGAVLLVVWLGTDRWCVRPLRYLRNFAERVARGDDLKFEPKQPWVRELVSVGIGVQALAEAIAAREAELKAGLEQRDHMLREIHHRVKNNLQMISSLLNLQAGEIRSPRIRRFFGDAQNRVLTLSILHRHLYERSSWALVDFQQFISDLVRQISVGRRPADRPQPRYHIRAPTMAVGPDIAIPVGLIVTEAVGGALNRSLNGGGAVEIRIEAAEKGGEVELMVEDNASGDARDIALQGGFGLTLIRGLAMQLGGEARISISESGGMRIAVTFPMPEDQDSHG